MIPCHFIQSLSHVRLLATPWTIAHQALLSSTISRSWLKFTVIQSVMLYWTRLPFASPGDPPNPGIKLKPPALAGGFFTTEPPGKPIPCHTGVPTTIWWVLSCSCYQSDSNIKWQGCHNRVARLGGLNNRNLFSHSTGAWEIHGVHRIGFFENLLAYRWPSLPMSSHDPPSVYVYVLISSSYKDISQ